MGERGCNLNTKTVIFYKKFLKLFVGHPQNFREHFVRLLRQKMVLGELAAPLFGVMVLTASTTALAVGTYEAVRHRHLRLFATSPAGKAAAYSVGGGVLLFIMYNGLHKESGLGDYHSMSSHGSSRYFAAGLAGAMGMVAIIYNYVFAP